MTDKPLEPDDDQEMRELTRRLFAGDDNKPTAEQPDRTTDQTSDRDEMRRWVADLFTFND